MNQYIGFARNLTAKSALSKKKFLPFLPIFLALLYEEARNLCTFPKHQQQQQLDLIAIAPGKYSSLVRNCKLGKLGVTVNIVDCVLRGSCRICSTIRTKLVQLRGIKTNETFNFPKKPAIFFPFPATSREVRLPPGPLALRGGPRDHGGRRHEPIRLFGPWERQEVSFFFEFPKNKEIKI